MSNTLPAQFKRLIRPIEAVGEFISTMGGDDSEDDDFCQLCEQEKAKTTRRSKTKGPNDKVSQLRDSVRLHKSHGNEANNALRHAKLGRALHGRFEQHGDPHDLDEAIAQLSTAMSILPPRHKHKPMYESNVGLLLCVRYEHTHIDRDLDKAVTHCRNALTGSDAQSTATPLDKAWYRANLATALLHRYERHKQAQNLEESLSLWRIAIAALPEGHPDKASYQSNLSAVYLARYQHSSTMDDLDRSIVAIRSAVKGTPKSDPHWMVYQYMASSLYHRRWNKTHKNSDLDHAIESGRAALAALPPKHRYSSRYQAELATKLLTRFDHSGKLGDIDEAISLSKEAAVSFAHSAYPAERTTTPAGRLVALSLALSKRYEKTDDIEDLDESIKHGRSAARLADKSRSEERHNIHENLSGLIYQRFERVGDLDDLDDSISHATIAIDATPGSRSQIDRDDLALKLATLSSHHLTRYEFQRKPVDLDSAVGYAQTAVDLVKAGGPGRHKATSAVCYALGLALFRRFEQHSDMADLDKAVTSSRMAFDSVSQYQATGAEADSRKTLYESLLSGVLCARYKKLGEQSDLEGAIAHAESVLHATPKDHPLYEMYKTIQSYALLAAPESRVGIEDSISRAREETERAQSRGDQNWGKLMLQLSNMLYERYGRGRDARVAEILPGNVTAEAGITEHLDLEHALGGWRKVAVGAVRSVPSPLSIRFRAALKWAVAACIHGRFKPAVEAYKTVMILAPRVSVSGIKESMFEAGSASVAGEENEMMLHTFSLVADAAAAAIQIGQIETAIEFLEQGRSLLWTEALGLPNDVDKLEKHNAELARHIKASLKEQEVISSTASNIVSSRSPINQNRSPFNNNNFAEEAAKLKAEPDSQWISLVGTVRASEGGFENFLRPWTLERIRKPGAITPIGPIVWLNSSRIRCDAIVLSSAGTPHLVHFPKLSSADLEQWAARLVGGMKDLSDGIITGFEFDKTILGPILKELGDRVVIPVLERLEDIGVSGRCAVGWIPTGDFTWLPLHAATMVAEESRDRWARFSFYYGATLQSLLHPSILHNGPSRVLAVSDQASRRTSTPLLGGIGTSIQALKKQLEEAENTTIECLEGSPQAVPSRITHALQPPESDPDSALDVLHFSCPTHCDALRPTNSSWSTANGGALKLGALLSLLTSSVPPPEFLFTASPSYRLDGPIRAGGKTSLPQELMSPAGALQFTGIRAVVGQLWNVSNEDAAVVAKHVYGKSADGRSSVAAGAASLMEAVTAMKENQVPLFRTVPFVRYGP